MEEIHHVIGGFPNTKESVVTELSEEKAPSRSWDWRTL